MNSNRNLIGLLIEVIYIGDCISGDYYLIIYIFTYIPCHLSHRVYYIHL